MAGVTINSLQKLQLADEILRSGQGTAEERAAIQLAMKQVQPSVDFIMGYAEKGTFDSNTYTSLDDDNMVIANEWMRKKAKRNSGDVKAGTLGVLGGMGRGAVEIGQNAAEMLGMDSLGGYLNSKGEDITDATTALAVSIKQDAYGRRFSEEELAAEKESIEGLMKAGELTERVAFSMAPGKFLGMAKGFWSGLALGATEGAVTGALAADIEQGSTAEERSERRVGDATIGTLLGAPLGAITGSFASLKNWAAGKVQSMANSAEDVFRVADEFDVPVTLGQASGNPVIQAAEEMAQGNIAQGFYREQTDALVQNIARRVDVSLPEIENMGANLPSRVKNAFSSLDDVIKDLRKAGQLDWQAAAKEANAVGGDNVIMGVSDLQEAMNDVATEIGERFGGAAVMGKNFTGLLEEVKNAALNGGATADEVSRWWLRINTMSQSPSGSGFVEAAKEAKEIGGPMMDALAGKLRIALGNSIEAAGDSPAIAILRRQRQAWSANQANIRTIEDGVLGALGLRGEVTAQSINKAMDSIPLETMSYAMDHIRGLPGGAAKVREIQGALFESAATAGLRKGVPTPGQSGELHIPTFVSALGDTARRSRLAGVLDPAQEEAAQEGVHLMRMILNEGAQRAGVVKTRLILNLENFAINVVSQDPAFTARLAASVVQRGKGAEALFFTREGIEVLRSLHPSWRQFGKTAEARQAAIVLLTGMLSDGAKERTMNSVQQGLFEGENE